MRLQSVRAKTRRGHVVLVADAAHLCAHVDTGRVFPLTHNVEQVVEGYATLKKLATSRVDVVPGHYPPVLATYSGGEAGARRLSGAARDGFKGVSTTTATKAFIAPDLWTYLRYWAGAWGLFAGFVSYLESRMISLPPTKGCKSDSSASASGLA